MMKQLLKVKKKPTKNQINIGQIEIEIDSNSSNLKSKIS